jgi:hypothetical protein
VEVLSLSNTIGEKREDSGFEIDLVQPPLDL